MHHYIDDYIDVDVLKKQLLSEKTKGILQTVDGKVAVIRGKKRGRRMLCMEKSSVMNVITVA